jgi:hypothetical protein
MRSGEEAQRIVQARIDAGFASKQVSEKRPRTEQVGSRPPTDLVTCALSPTAPVSVDVQRAGRTAASVRLTRIATVATVNQMNIAAWPMNVMYPLAV